MSGFSQAQEVESDGMAVLLPFLRRHAHEGQFVTTAKGRLSREFQLKYGDVFANDNNGNVRSIEVKIERDYARNSKNLFIETWSNKGFNRGWLYHCDADILWYYFLKTDDLYVIDMQEFKKWAILDENIERYREVVQRKYNQRNETCGRLIPVNDLRDADLIMSEWHPYSEINGPSPIAA